MEDITYTELCEIYGGGPLGRLIGWIGGVMAKSAMIEMEVCGYVDNMKI